MRMMVKKKCKIGIVTWFNSENYGTNLQAYALYRKITLLGYECSLINEFNYKKFGVRQFLMQLLQTFGLYSLCKKRIRSSCNRKRLISTINFFNKNVNVEYIFTTRKYNELINKYNTFISGSDQIWNPNYLKTFYFLDFAGNNRKIAYASSIGVNKLTEEQSPIYRNYLSNFHKIGVRERSGANLINEILDKEKAVQVVDPTFLLKKEEWGDIISQSNINYKFDYIFCYLIGNRKDYIDQLLDVAQIANINNIVVVPSIENPNFRVNNKKLQVIYLPDASLADFIKLIMNSTIVCTDSFHATALSINFHKNFIEFMRFSNDDIKSQNSRIIDVLDRYGLKNRIYSLGNKSLANTINYKSVSKILNEDIERSIKFLTTSIEA